MPLRCGPRQCGQSSATTGEDSRQRSTTAVRCFIGSTRMVRCPPGSYYCSRSDRRAKHPLLRSRDLPSRDWERAVFAGPLPHGRSTTARVGGGAALDADRPAAGGGPGGGVRGKASTNSRSRRRPTGAPPRWDGSGRSTRRGRGLLRPGPRVHLP
jgi:hypothetical protein